MLFNSYIFIFAFFPLCLLGFYLLKRCNQTAAKIWLTGFSLWFYGYFNYSYLLIMLFSILFNYVIYQGMMYYKDELFYPYLDDWILNSNNRILVPGLGAYQMVEMKWLLKDITDQVDYSRHKNVQGQAYFRTENVLSNTKGILNSLEKQYEYPSKLPPMTWLSDSIPEKPFNLSAEKNEDEIFELRWECADKNSRVTYNVYRSETDDFSKNYANNIIATGLREPYFSYKAEINDLAYYYFITVSDSYHNESEISIPAFFFHSNIIK